MKKGQKETIIHTNMKIKEKVRTKNERKPANNNIRQNNLGGGGKPRDAAQEKEVQV